MTIYERRDGWYFLFNGLEYGPFLSRATAEDALAVQQSWFCS